MRVPQKTVTEVEQILDTRLFGRWKKWQYLIKWKGYAEAHNSWDPEENVNVPELVKEFHQQTGVHARLRVLKDRGETEEPTMTQLVDSNTPLPHPHSPRLLSPFSIDRHGNYPLLDQILLDGPPLVMILPPPDPFSMSLIPCLPHNTLHFHLCCRYFTSCHPFRLFRQLCLSNSFPSVTLSLSTSLAALGSYAYPILSHIFPSLMSSSPPFLQY